MLYTIDSLDELEQVVSDAAYVGPFQDFLKQFPTKAIQFGVRLALAIAAFFIGVQIIRIVRKLIKKSLTYKDADKGVISFLDSFVKFIGYVILLFVIASGFGLDAASVIALLGSTGLAIGLALQGSLSNLAGGVLILLLKPFKVGDYIKEDTKGNEGIVVDIHIFYTKLLTMDNKMVILPNGDLANTSLTNYTNESYRRIDIPVYISYNADILTAKYAIAKVLKECDKVVNQKEQIVFVNELGEHGVQLNVRFWSETQNYWPARWDVTEKIKYALDEIDIEIPFNQLDVHVKNS